MARGRGYAGACCVGAAKGDVLRFQVLGPLSVRGDDGEPLVVRRAKQRALLGLLLLRANDAVPAESIVDILWGERPPASATANLQTYVANLRRLLRTAQPAGAARLAWQHGCYRLLVEPDELDAVVFQRLAATGRQALRADESAVAAQQLARAVGLWRGRVLEGLDLPAFEPDRARLEELRQVAVEDGIDARLALGQHDELPSELEAQLRQHPLRERLWAQLMLALHRAGRQGEALAAYRRATACLADELGLPPGPALRQLHERMVAADGTLDLPPRTAVGVAGSGRPSVPAQLPADVAEFTGRTAELSILDALLTGGTRSGPSGPSPGRICAVSGTAGVGKTALAVRWAHGVADRFPDGQLYVDLRGYDPGQPVDPAEALAGFLRGLGVVAADIPGNRDERAARYRTELAGRRVLVVLDNAGTVEQVRPLLPGTATAAVVVTSRDALPGLVAVHGARRIELDLLPLADAVALLRHLLGPTRIAAEPEAAAALAARCARLPLALRVAAELAVRRDLPLARLVTELADQQQCLETLDATGDDRSAVTAVFSWSIQHLPADAARLFRLLGLHPGPDLDPRAAAALADTTVGQARLALDTLARAHLTQPTGTGRYGLHDLLRAYATRLATREQPQDQRRSALTRLFDYYRATTAAAMGTWYPAEAYRYPQLPPPATPVPTFASGADALAWLDSERSVLVAVCADAARGWPAHAVALASTLFRYLDAGGHHTDAATVHGLAQPAAHDTGDRVGEARALTDLAVVAWRQGRHGPAARHLRRALRLLRQAGDRTPDRVGEARVLYHLGSVDWWQSRYRPAARRYQQALALFRQTGDRAGEGYALVGLGDIGARLGYHEQAAEQCARGLALCRQAGHRAGEAYALTTLGLVRGLQGRPEAAAEHHRQALRLCRQAGNRTGEAYALGGLGDVHARLGQHRQAADRFTEALVLFRRTGDRAGEAEALNGLGDAVLAAGDLSRALAQHTAALTLATDTGDRYQQARAHDGLAQAHQLLADTSHARRHRQHALTLYADLGTPEAGEIRLSLDALRQP